jgi:hypothetical protein
MDWLNVVENAAWFLAGAAWGWVSLVAYFVARH